MCGGESRNMGTRRLKSCLYPQPRARPGLCGPRGHGQGSMKWTTIFHFCANKRQTARLSIICRYSQREAVCNHRPTRTHSWNYLENPCLSVPRWCGSLLITQQPTDSTVHTHTHTAKDRVFWVWRVLKLYSGVHLRPRTDTHPRRQQQQREQQQQGVVNNNNSSTTSKSSHEVGGNAREFARDESYDAPSERPLGHLACASSEYQVATT